MSANQVPANQSPLHDGLSVDVEDFFHVEAFSDRISPDSWPNFPSRVRGNTHRILDFFAEYGHRATFFILGWVAERDPALIREIAEAGHELACHSYAHRRVDRLTPQQFREDLRRARDTIENASGVKVVGYRAPTFSIVRESLWGLDILAEEGFLYDSSIFPTHHDHYGFPQAPRFPIRAELNSGATICEIPMSTVRVCGMNLPVGGGGYLRILPMFYTRWAVRHLQSTLRRPVNVYIHPWEFDPEQPRLEGSWKSRLRHYRGLDKTLPRMRELLAGGKFGTLHDLILSLDQSGALPQYSLDFIERGQRKVAKRLVSVSAFK